MHILPLKRQPFSYLKVLTVLFCITCPLFQFYAQSPAVGHKGRVNDCTYNAASQSFFTAGADGFVSEWKNDTKVDSYQVSVIPVVKIVAKPDSTIIAVYESDGFATHKVSVWDWSTKKRMYTKRFSDSVLSLTFSAKGTWLIVSTSSMNGLAFFYAHNGVQKNILDTVPSNVCLAQTSASEAMFVTYSLDGYITFFDMRSGDEKGQIPTESDISRPVLHRHNALLSGYSSNTQSIVTINMKNGEIVNTYLEENSDIAFLDVCAVSTDIEPVIFEYFPQKIITRSYDDAIHAESQNNITDDLIFTAVAYSGTDFVVGTEQGDVLYITQTEISIQPEVITVPGESVEASSLSEKNENTESDGNVAYETFETDEITAEPMRPNALDISIFTANNRHNVLDVACASSGIVYILTDGIVHFQTESDVLPQKLCEIESGYNRIESCDDDIILWSDYAVRPVVLLQKNTSMADAVVLYQPAEPLSSGWFSKTFSTVIENYSKVSVIDMVMQKTIFSYSGAGFQNGIYRQNDNALFVAKTAASEPRSILLRIDTVTGETVPSNIDGTVLYGLNSNVSVTKAYGYIILESTTPGQMVTELSEIDLQKMTSRRIAKYEAENVESFLTYRDNRLYTDLSVNSISEINIATPSQIKQNIIKRGTAMPRTIKVSDKYLLILNKDGTYSWYNKKQRTPLSTITYIDTEVWNIEEH